MQVEVACRLVGRGAGVSGRCGRLLWSQAGSDEWQRGEAGKPSGLVIVQVDVIKRHYHI